MSTYTPIIGLEIHVELKTASKMFCGCSAEHFQVTPNTHTCPVCLGMPGALPVPNFKAVQWCQRIGLALNCGLRSESKFDRKNYFYPDLAKGYQISQYDEPLCEKGWFELSTGKRIGITRVHMEEDTAKNVHKTVNGKKMTLIDFNRSGVPLVEIVTEPDFRSAGEVDEFLKELRKIIRYLGVSNADMEKGSMRLELNMSLAPTFDTTSEQPLPKYKVEVKNINSFRYLLKAIEYEYQRQSEILDSGKVPVQETRGYQEGVDRTISQRSKEEAQDYRYFPEPDIPPMVFDEIHIELVKREMPELPQAKNRRFISDYGLAADTAAFLTETRELAEFFESAVEKGKAVSVDPVQIANTIKNKKCDWQKMSPSELVDKVAGASLGAVMDESELIPVIDEVIAGNPEVVDRFKAGKKQVLGFLIGQVMAKTQGKADAQAVSRLITEKLL
jgi:aspartyl-tRNA(Asn)/glutamyl-tRNA(Gln) amidotransferase subunit B